MPDNTGEGYRLRLKAGFWFLCLITESYRIVNLNRKSAFERRETGRVIISFQNEMTISL
jgi:hypothetical protein